MSDEAGLRDVLLEHSDHRAVRRVWEEIEGSGEADLDDYVETMRATGGTVAIVGKDEGADVYARFTRGQFQHLTVWPPWSLGGLERVDGDGLVEFLAGKEDVRAIHIEETPFADEDQLEEMTDRSWP